MISNNLKIVLVICSVILMLIIIRLLRKNRISIKYSMFWFFLSIVIFIVGLFPDFVHLFTNLFGFETTSNLIIGIILVSLMLITLVQTLIITQNRKLIVKLIQEISLMKGDIEK